MMSMLYCRVQNVAEQFAKYDVICIEPYVYINIYTSKIQMCKKNLHKTKISEDTWQTLTIPRKLRKAWGNLLSTYNIYYVCMSSSSKNTYNFHNFFLLNTQHI